MLVSSIRCCWDRLSCQPAQGERTTISSLSIGQDQFSAKRKAGDIYQLPKTLQLPFFILLSLCNLLLWYLWHAEVSVNFQSSVMPTLWPMAWISPQHWTMKVTALDWNNHIGGSRRNLCKQQCSPQVFTAWSELIYPAAPLLLLSHMEPVLGMHSLPLCHVLCFSSFILIVLWLILYLKRQAVPRHTYTIQSIILCHWDILLIFVPHFTKHHPL